MTWDPAPLPEVARCDRGNGGRPTHRARSAPGGPASFLPPGIDDVWRRPSASAPWRIQVMLDESEGDEWVSRRDPRVRRAISSLGAVSADGIPYLAPEVQLYAKSRNTRRRWLAEAIGKAHPWSDRL